MGRDERGTERVRGVVRQSVLYEWQCGTRWPRLFSMPGDFVASTCSKIAGEARFYHGIDVKESLLRGQRRSKTIPKAEYNFYFGSTFHQYDDISLKQWFTTDMEFI